MRRWFILGCVVLGCVSTPALAIKARAELMQMEIVGVIASCKGSITGFKLSRAGQKKQPVKVFMPLQEGDQITAQASSSVLTISYTDGTTTELRKEDSPFIVKAHGHPVSLSDYVLRLFSWTDKLQTPLAVTGARGKAETRDEPLGWIVPGLSDDTARILGGKRRLGVTWKGGKGPYHAVFKASGGETLLNERTGGKEVFSIKPLKLSSGPYRVFVTDAKGKQIEGSFTVVEPSAFPAVEAAPAWFPKGAARAVHAQELASKEGYRWCYEAYLSLIGVEEDLGGDGKNSWAARLRQEICF